MNFGKILYNLLSNDADVSGIVGNRIYPGEMSQSDNYPAITFRQISNDPDKIKNAAIPLDIPRIDIHIYSRDFDQVQTLHEHIRDAIDRYSGTVEGINVDWISYDDSNYLFENDGRLHHQIDEYLIRIKR